jgi:hypothetical protein
MKEDQKSIPFFFFILPTRTVIRGFLCEGARDELPFFLFYTSGRQSRLEVLLFLFLIPIGQIRLNQVIDFQQLSNSQC